jgi:pyruvate ferredoxin oxidoreductase delta subunit
VSTLPPGLPAEAGSSVANKTGGWATEQPRFLMQACTGCDLCAIYCPEGIVQRLGPKRYGYDATYCKGCGICVEECPVDDIAMEAVSR